MVCTSQASSPLTSPSHLLLLPPRPTAPPLPIYFPLQADALAFLDELDGDGADGSAAAGGSAGGRGTAAAAGAGRFSVGPGQQQAAAAAAAAAAASAAAGEWGSDEEINEDEWDDGEAAAERRLRSGCARQSGTERISCYPRSPLLRVLSVSFALVIRSHGVSMPFHH